jgi:hypothetical protein
MPLNWTSPLVGGSPFFRPAPSTYSTKHQARAASTPRCRSPGHSAAPKKSSANRKQALPPAEQQVGTLLCTPGWGGCAGLVDAQMQRFLADVYVSLQAPRCTAQAALDTVVLRMWLVSSVTAVAARPLFCFVMAATGVIIGAVSPQLCLKCQMVSGIVRIASRVTGPLHNTVSRRQRREGPWPSG